mgnify:CR=1 FL=1
MNLRKYKLINTENNFIVDTFVQLGYYPQLFMNECMPNLEWIPLPSISDEDLIDVTSVEEESNNGTTSIVKLHLNNPAAEKIISVGVQDIQTVEVLSQDNEAGKSVVRIKISNPLSYKSKYYLRVITSQGHLGYSYNTDFDQYERPLDITMYYPINSISDWMRIKTNPDENYILTDDLDFNGVAEASIYISSHFTGVLNGNGHTISNIKINNIITRSYGNNYHCFFSY